jgi:cell division septal protein FtsQ
MEKIFPGTLNITVIERKPFAFFTHLGVGYILAQDGIILEKTRELRDGSGLILVNGLAVWGQQALGTLPASTDLVQAEILVDLFEQLSVWGFEDQLNNIDITQSMNISMQTKDGFTINLGTAEQLHAKVGTVASVVNALRSRQMSGGIIEATLPGEATYRAQ